jgi:hypothetical protein
MKAYLSADLFFDYLIIIARSFREELRANKKFASHLASPFMDIALVASQKKWGHH